MQIHGFFCPFRSHLCQIINEVLKILSFNPFPRHQGFNALHNKARGAPVKIPDDNNAFGVNVNFIQELRFSRGKRFVKT